MESRVFFSQFGFPTQADFRVSLVLLVVANSTEPCCFFVLFRPVPACTVWIRTPCSHPAGGCRIAAVGGGRRRPPPHGWPAAAGPRLPRQRPSPGDCGRRAVSGARAGGTRCGVARGCGWRRRCRRGIGRRLWLWRRRRRAHTVDGRRTTAVGVAWLALPLWFSDGGRQRGWWWATSATLPPKLGVPEATMLAARGREGAEAASGRLGGEEAASTWTPTAPSTLSGSTARAVHTDVGAVGPSVTALPPPPSCAKSGNR